jgi:cellulose synthase/poly-beta-1,6-N-acetylglucosamine synthase-like glycosyltransferase
MPEQSMAYPFVSVLVAARNEAHTITGCLAALAALDYPPDRYEVLIGNDASEDDTAAVVAAFITEKVQFWLVDIPEGVVGYAISRRYGISSNTLGGKANVLAQLARQAQGEYLFTTDADVRVPRTWLTAMLAEFSPNTGVVTGTTLVAGRSFWARLQAIDWLLAFGLIHIGTYLKLPLTGSGNNMAFRREAYEAIGGFENLPPSVVEDYTLFQAIVAHGYGHAHRLAPDVLAETLPTPTLGTYLAQRKRWMRGAFSLPPLLVGGVLAQYLLVPLLFALALFLPKTAVFIFAAKWLLQTTLLTWVLQRTHQRYRWPEALLFEPIQAVLGTLAVGYYLWPGKVQWKGRSY